MKKWLCLLLAVLLFACTASAAAEDEATVTFEGTEFPFTPYGVDSALAADIIILKWSAVGASLSVDPVQTIASLEDGTELIEQTFFGSGDGFDLQAVFFYTEDGQAVAGVQDFTLSEGNDGSMFHDLLVSEYGEPEPLELDVFGVFTDLLLEEALMTAGQDMWEYTARVDLPDAEAPVETKAIVTMCIIENHIYMASCMDSRKSSDDNDDHLRSSGTAELEGYGQLTQEEKDAVDLYAEFLSIKMKQQLEEYISFLLKKHQ